MVYGKILKELERYVKLRLPYDTEDLDDEFFPIDAIEAGGLLIEASPLIGNEDRCPGAYFYFYRNCRPDEIEIDAVYSTRTVKFVGFVSFIMDIGRKRIIESQADWNSKVSRFKRSYKDSDGNIHLYPLKYDNVECRSKIVLCIDEMFYENGGREKGLQDFCNQLTLLNIGLL